MTTSHSSQPTRIMPNPATETPCDVSAVTRLLRRTLTTDVGATATAPPETMAARGQRELLIIVNDISGSMAEPYDAGHNKLAASCRASCNLVLQKERIDPQDRVGLITFTQTASLLLAPQPVGTHKRQMIQLLQGMQAGGGTDIAAGLSLAEQALRCREEDWVLRIVLLTDGYGGDPRQLAQWLKEQGVVIDVVGVGPSPGAVDEPLLRNVASTVDGQLRYRFITDQQTLIQHYTHLAAKTRLG